MNRPKIITIAHQKGGVGKSTLVLNIALAMSALPNLKIGIADTDPQGTISNLPGIDNFKVDMAAKYWQNLNEMPFDIVLIDTPPYIGEDTQRAFLISDVVIIPTKPGIPDLMAIAGTIDLLRQAKLKNKAIRAGIVINMVKPRSLMTGDIEAQLIAHYPDIPVLCRIGDRVSYSRSMLTGGVLNGVDEIAKNEISLLVNKITELL
jgi:chromosome partitioning protein